jgi:hypothetical protein
MPYALRNLSRGQLPRVEGPETDDPLPRVHQERVELWKSGIANLRFHDLTPHVRNASG